jgi:transcriptional regulator with XRE-family HTH domain
MPTKERLLDRGNRNADRLRRVLGLELREARLAAGLSQKAVGSAARISYSEVSRIERGRLPGVSVEQYCRLFAVVGLDFSARSYPFGLPLHDAAQVALLARFEAVLHPSLRLRREVALPRDADLRAWDGVVYGAGAAIAVEAETRLRDVQALLRRISLKQRDGDVTRVILLVADTRTNRRVLRETQSLFGEFPVGPRSALAALRSGSDPAGSGIVIL